MAAEVARGGRASAAGNGAGALPWAFVLDPTANARALGEVQRRGVHAARELVDRVLSTLDGPAGAPAEGAGSGGAGAPRNSVPDGALGELVLAWWGMAAQVLSAVVARAPGSDPDAGAPADSAPAAGAPAGVPRVVADVTGGGPHTAWRLELDTAGGLLVPAELWLSNPSATAGVVLSPRVGDLQTAEGRTLSGACVRFEPPEVTLAARSARGVVPIVAPTDPLCAGMYRGVLQAAAAPGLCVTVEVAVRGAPA